MHQQPYGVARHDPGYESDDADCEASNEESTHYGQERDYFARMSTSRGPPNVPREVAPFGHSAGSTLPDLDTYPSLLRPDSPSNESSASTDDDNMTANANDPHALGYYLENDDTWRESEMFSQSSEEGELSDDDELIARHVNGVQHPDGVLLTTSSPYSDMGVYSHTHHLLQRRPRHPNQAPRMPKRIPLVPTCSKSRKRASMRGAWKMRFGRLFESDSDAGTEVEDELDWEGYESADARRIVAMRILKAGGGDGRKVMQGKELLAELLVKQPIDSKRLAARVPRRSRAHTIRGADPAVTIQPPAIDTCATCSNPTMSPTLSTKSVPATATESPVSTNSASLITPTSTPPTSVPNTPCPECAQLSPREDALQLPLTPPMRHKVLSPRSPPCKTTPLGAGTDPLTVFAVTMETERQRDFSGLLKRSMPPSESMFGAMSNGLLRGVKSFFVKLNNFVDFAANSPLPTSIEGTCPLSPVMGVNCPIAQEVGGRRRAVSTPEISPSPRPRSQRRRSYLRSPISQPSLPLPGTPTSPYGYRVKPHQVSAAFPALVSLDERMGNVVATPVPAVEGVDSVPSARELEAILTRPLDTYEEPLPSDPLPIAPIDLKGPPANSAEVRRRRASRSTKRRPSSKRPISSKVDSDAEREKAVRAEVLEANQNEISRSRAVVDSKYWRVLAGEMEQRRKGGVEVAFMVRLAVEEGRNLPVFTSDERQAATGEIIVGGVWKASLARWRVGGVGKGPTRIRSSLAHEVSVYSDASDTASDSSSSF